MNGLQLCARYAFAPNYLKYCGPDANKEIAGYIHTGTTDLGLSVLLNAFETMSPYLKFIAHENGLTDPFHPEVVEAYWIGNHLLANISLKSFWEHLLNTQQLKKRLKPKDLYWLSGKIPQEATVHHSFHVFNIFTRTGHLNTIHTLTTMDQCRIGWGKVLRIKAQTLNIDSQQLVIKNGKLKLIKQKRNVFLPIEDWSKKKKWVGKLVTYHWNTVCDVVSQNQAKRLAYFTEHHLNLANQTI
jgi:hypothetical protein